MSLQSRLQKLVNDAEAACPHAVKCELQGGLNINLRKLSAEEVEALAPEKRLAPAMYVLTLWRPRVHPSIQEWNIVTTRLPYLCPIVNPAKLHTGERYYLQAYIPARPPEPHGRVEFISDWIFASKVRKNPPNGEPG
jgi:hypothetical protein